MNPFDALKYMKETGKSVVPEKLSPCNWIAKEPGVNEWIKHRYQFVEEMVVELYDNTPTTAILIKAWEWMDWVNHWGNFFYNTNSSDHNIELIPYERRQSNISI